MGRDDVAALAAALALTDFNTAIEKKGRYKPNRSDDRISRGINRIDSNGERSIDRVRHITLAVRWAGEHLSQGRKRDGLPHAEACVDSILKLEARADEKMKRLDSNVSSNEWTRLRSIAVAAWKKRRMKPYGVFVLLPLMIVYPTVLSIISRALFFKVP